MNRTTNGMILLLSIVAFPILPALSYLFDKRMGTLAERYMEEADMIALYWHFTFNRDED